MWTLALQGWRHWNRGTKLSGKNAGARIRRWWWRVNNWPLDQSASSIIRSASKDKKFAFKTKEVRGDPFSWQASRGDWLYNPSSSMRCNRVLAEIERLYNGDTWVEQSKNMTQRLRWIYTTFFLTMMGQKPDGSFGVCGASTYTGAKEHRAHLSGPQVLGLE